MIDGMKTTRWRGKGQTANEKEKRDKTEERREEIEEIEEVKEDQWWKTVNEILKTETQIEDREKTDRKEEKKTEEETE